MVLTSGLARVWLDPATPKEHAEQVMLDQDEPADVFNDLRSTLLWGMCGTMEVIQSALYDHVKTKRKKFSHPGDAAI